MTRRTASRCWWCLESMQNEPCFTSLRATRSFRGRGSLPRKRPPIAVSKWTSHDSAHRLSVLVVFRKHAERTAIRHTTGGLSSGEPVSMSLDVVREVVRRGTNGPQMQQVGAARPALISA
mmetsp:Transcript_111003/g.353705  ORF Transcript_111003/g.353705 Transcript_111003/m.353705 type:complete len:120 (+) Transcript_111003:1896-2255(+)